MPSYTVLVQSGRNRLIRNEKNGTSAVVTTVPDGGHPAATIAQALTAATTDLPHALVCYVLDQLDCWHLCPAEWRESGSLDDWAELPAPVEPFSLRRRALNALDAGEVVVTDPVTGISRNSLPAVANLRRVLVDAPESVRRAVRDELAAAYAPYEGVPVVARAYDYKWGDYESLFLANAALGALTDDEAHQVLREPELRASSLADVLERDGLADFSDAERVAMSGYFQVDLNSAQLHAWHAARGTADRPRAEH